MATADQHLADRASPPSGPGPLGDLVVATPLVLALIAGTWWLLRPPASYLYVGGALYATLAALVAWKLPGDAPGPGIGKANRVTLGRAAVALPVLALSVQPGSLGDGGRWWVILLSTLVLVLDGWDGRVARRTGTETAFGARFDMELDAALLMALSLLVWRTGRAGAWVLLIGLMRYLFVAAGWALPALRVELPPSLRRKVVCVVQGVVLLVALGPIVPAGMAVAVVAVGLVSLVYSFGVDAAWALRHGGEAARRA